MKPTKERKRLLIEVIEKYANEISQLSILDLSKDYAREKIKLFIWTKIKPEINYSHTTYYMDIFLNIKKAHKRHKILQHDNQTTISNLKPCS